MVDDVAVAGAGSGRATLFVNSGFEAHGGLESSEGVKWGKRGWDGVKG